MKYQNSRQGEFKDSTRALGDKLDACVDMKSKCPDLENEEHGCDRQKKKIKGWDGTEEKTDTPPSWRSVQKHQHSELDAPIP